jgi:hypothetical protein
MTFGARYLRTRELTGVLAVALALWSADARAGEHRTRVQTLTPVYLQAPTATYMQAPAATYYQAPAMTYAQAPAATYAQAPAVTYAQAPAVTYAQAPAAVGSAPGAVYGARIKAVDRDDLIADLRKEFKESGTSGSGSTMRERRKSLRDSARTKYAELLGREESELNDYESQDVDQIVSSLLDSNGVGQAPAVGAGYPMASGYSYPPASYAPMYAPAQPSMIVQPVVPVQLFVPIQPKHHHFLRR